MPFPAPYVYPSTQPPIQSTTKVEYEAPCPACKVTVPWVVGLRRTDYSSATSSEEDRGVLTYKIHCECGAV